MVTGAQIVEKNKEYTITSWSVQKQWNPITMASDEVVWTDPAAGDPCDFAGTQQDWHIAAKGG